MALDYNTRNNINIQVHIDINEWMNEQIGEREQIFFMEELQLTNV